MTISSKPSSACAESTFPIERPVEDAWTDFLGWRVNYEAAAYALAWATDAPPALWSGPRRHEIESDRPPSAADGRNEQACKCRETQRESLTLSRLGRRQRKVVGNPT